MTLLKAHGYSVVRLPKADIRPLQVLAKQGKALDRLGEISTLLIADAAAGVPPITENVQAANISGQQTGEVSFGVGLSILGNVIAAMGGSKLGIETQYKGAKAVVFEFEDVLTDSVEVLKLDQYLAGADVNPLSRSANELLDADRLYVTTAILKSKKFSVEARRADGGAVQVDVPVVQQVVGANVKVSDAKQAVSKVTYEGAVSLVFGFQAVQLFYDRGEYTRFKPLEPGDGYRALDLTPDDGSTRFSEEGPFVRLSGD